MKKKYKILLMCLVAVAVCVSVVCTVFYFNQDSGMYAGINEKQWALYNKGQKINDSTGKKGVDLNIVKAWELYEKSEPVIVGVLDAGIDIDAEVFAGRIYTNPKEKMNGLDDDGNGYIDDIHGWNFYNGNNEVYDNYLHDHHGTYMASLIAANHTEGSEVWGINPDVVIMPLKFMRGSYGIAEDAVKAIEYAHQMGVKIINCSWDTTEYNKELEDTMRKYDDILFVCSAGKSGSDIKEVPVYPACYDLPNVISVTAINNKGLMYDLANYGEEIDVAAPGEDIYGAFPDGDYTYSSGTSAATALVSGVASLIKSTNPELSAVEIADIIIGSYKEIDDLEGNCKNGGIIDAYECMKKATKK